MSGEPTARIHAADIVGRARAGSAPDGRLALPKLTTWPIFPFEPEGLRMRPLEDPVVPEPPREGEAGGPCSTCQTPDEAFVWAGARWRVGMSTEPQALPAAMLYPATTSTSATSTTSSAPSSASSSPGSSGRWPRSRGWAGSTSTSGATAPPTCTCSSSAGPSG